MLVVEYYYWLVQDADNVNSQSRSAAAVTVEGKETANVMWQYFVGSGRELADDCFAIPFRWDLADNEADWEQVPASLSYNNALQISYQVCCILV